MFINCPYYILLCYTIIINCITGFVKDLYIFEYLKIKTQINQQKISNSYLQKKLNQSFKIRRRKKKTINLKYRYDQSQEH